MADAVTFTMDLGTLGVKAKALNAGLDRVVDAYMASQAPRVQDYARTHRGMTLPAMLARAYSLVPAAEAESIK
jgi:hypothetical protein